MHMTPRLALPLVAAMLLVVAACRPATGQSSTTDAPAAVTVAPDDLIANAPAVGESVERTDDEWRA